MRSWFAHGEILLFAAELGAPLPQPELHAGGAHGADAGNSALEQQRSRWQSPYIELPADLFHEGPSPLFSLLLILMFLWSWLTRSAIVVLRPPIGPLRRGHPVVVAISHVNNLIRDSVGMKIQYYLIGNEPPTFFALVGGNQLLWVDAAQLKLST